MSTRSPIANSAATDPVLHWQGQVVSAEGLRRSLNGHQQLVIPAKAVITPLAAEHLRANGISITRETAKPEARRRSTWGFGQDRPQLVVKSAVHALERDGLRLQELPPPDDSSPCRWAHAVARCIAQGQCRGGVIFCQDAELLCCVAN